MEIRKQLELVNVETENGGKKAVFTFLDRERKEVRTVNFNKQAYKDGKYVDDEEKASQVEEWCETYFDLPFDRLCEAIGTYHDIYVYEKFNSLWECSVVTKFSPDMVGQIYQTEIKEIVVDDYFIKFHYEIDGETYESKMSFGTYLESTKEWFVDPQKKANQYEKFESKFGVPVSRKDELIGHPLMIEVKKAFGTALYGDMKAFPKKK